jgi:hypothetical protein
MFIIFSESTKWRTFSNEIHTKVEVFQLSVCVCVYNKFRVVLLLVDRQAENKWNQRN